MPQIHRQHGRLASSSGTPIPEGEEVPPIEFSDPEPPLEVCDQVLGGYIRCWGNVETAVAELFRPAPGRASHSSQGGDGVLDEPKDAA
jgi:hypothetical protein